MPFCKGLRSSARRPKVVEWKRREGGKAPWREVQPRGRRLARGGRKERRTRLGGVPSTTMASPVSTRPPSSGRWGAVGGWGGRQDDRLSTQRSAGHGRTTARREVECIDQTGLGSTLRATSMPTFWDRFPFHAQNQAIEPPTERQSLRGQSASCELPLLPGPRGVVKTVRQAQSSALLSGADGFCMRSRSRARRFVRVDRDVGDLISSSHRRGSVRQGR